MSLITIVLAAGVLLVLALIIAWILGWASKAFYVEVDPRITQINEVLPGANCGGCGYAGCNDYAERVVKKSISVSLCPVGGDACAKAIAKIMGVEVGEALPFRPVVHCVAHCGDKLKNAPYTGEQTCAGKNLISAAQGCVYGCLGTGDCVTVCNYNAIHIINGLATVDYDKCIGCKKCADICPRNIISMTPFKNSYVVSVSCSNREAGKDVRDVCTVGCLGCSLCVKASHDFFHISNNLAYVDAENDPSEHLIDIKAAIEKCPRHSIVLVGHPSEHDLALTEGLDDVKVVSPDFKTTVDDMKWRG